MKTKSFKRVTSLILTLAMLFSLAPASFAVDDPIDVSDDVVVSDVGNADQAADNTVDAEEPASEGEDVISDKNSRQSRRRLCITQSKNQSPFRSRKSEILLCQPSRNKFRHGRHHTHDNGHPYRGQIIQKHVKINQHSDPDQKKRNKQSVSHEFNPVHQCRCIRYQTI